MGVRERKEEKKKRRDKLDMAALTTTATIVLLLLLLTMTAQNVITKYLSIYSTSTAPECAAWIRRAQNRRPEIDS